MLTHENRNYTRESKERLNRVINKTTPSTNKDIAFKLFNDPQYEIYSKLFKSWSGTIHTSLYEPNSLIAWMALGQNSHPTSINFSNWLKGEKLNINYFEGEIDTPLTFATY